ncbi:MAG: protein kinase [Pyrinomonadaceae bacterium]
MAYCHECGSQVAEIDVFCPYCGITLKPISIGGEVDVSMDKTISVNQSEAFASPAVSEPVETGKADISETETKEDESLTGESFSPPTEENSDWKTESVDIPSEVFESEAAGQEEKLSNVSEASSEINKEEVSQAVESRDTNDSSEIPLPENIEILKPVSEMSAPVEAPDFNFEPQQEHEATNIEESVSADETSEETEKAGGGFDEAESPIVDSKDIEPASESSNFVSQTVEAETVQEQEASSDNVEDEPNPDDTDTLLASPANLSKEEFFPELKDENQSPIESENVAEEPIAKPAFDLEPMQKPHAESVFDSVQIVQKEEKQEPVEETSVEIVSKPEQKAEISEQSSEQKEGRSFTTPNIGGSDTDGKSQSKLKPLEEGTVLNNRYEIVRKIGGGGMGAVYLASDKNLGGVLRAVKEMVQSYIEETQQEKAVNDFKRESLLLTSLEHPAIPTIFDYFYDDKEQRFYLVMKYISGGDLASRLRSAHQGRVEEKDVTDWAIQIADVLEYLHNHQPPIVYRDLKPANIMIDGNSGRIMLIDFGIARWINKEEKGVTAVGTMGYAPPELFSGNVEPRSDIYSLGSTMFHLLTGADPQSNPLLIFDFQKNPRPRQINSQLSDQMERILMRSVEYNSDKRFESAREMRNTLQEHLENLKAGKITFGVKEIPASVALSEQPVFCGFCGQRIVATDMFCAFCGAKQPIAQQGIHRGEYAAPHNLTAKLMLMGTNDLESPSFYLEKDENLVGRRDPMSNIFPEVDLSKFDPQTKISRRHARIWRDGSNFLVEDLGSSNGTILLPSVSDTIRLLPHQPHILTSGDKIKIGDTTMHFVIG